MIKRTVRHKMTKCFVVKEGRLVEGFSRGNARFCSGLVEEGLHAGTPTGPRSVEITFAK